MAGIDSANQFPKSRMAQAVKLGQSRFMSADVPSNVQLPSQKNVDITNVAGTLLTLPTPSASSPGDWQPPTYAIVTAVGGPMYVTYDGTAPTAASYAIAVAAGASLPVQGKAAMGAAKFFGTTMSVSYWT